jgi:peroxiredoxin Q/BCP
MRIVPGLMAALFVLGAGAARADLEIGQTAPDFSLPDQNDKIHRLSDYRGKNVVLAFYPKAGTLG